MIWRFFEATNGFNWGKFGVGTWDHDGMAGRRGRQGGLGDAVRREVSPRPAGAAHRAAYDLRAALSPPDPPGSPDPPDVEPQLRLLAGDPLDEDARHDRERPGVPN